MNESVLQILKSIEYCTLATVSDDGSPWNVPLHFAFDDQYIYFRSPAGTVHGKNIAKDSRVSLVIFDSSQSIRGAVYIRSTAIKLEDDASITKLFNEKFGASSRQWDKTEYYRVAVGELIRERSAGAMYYFDAVVEV